MVAPKEPQAELSREEPRPAGSCLMVSIPVPGQPGGVPADIGRAMRNAAQRTAKIAQEGGKCRVEVFDGLPPYLRATSLQTGTPLVIPSARELGAFVEGKPSQYDDIKNQLERSANVLYEVISRTRDLLGLSALEVRRYSNTLHEPLDRSRLLGSVQNAPTILYGRSMKIDGRENMKMGDYIGNRFIPSFVREKREGGATHGDILYGYLQIARTIQKLIRNVVVFVYHREKSLVPAAEALLLNCEGLSEDAVQAIKQNYLPVTTEIEGFEIKKVNKGEKGEDGRKLRYAPPYLLGQARVPLFPVSTYDPTQYYINHFSGRNFNAQIAYVYHVVLPILHTMRMVADGGNTMAHDALHGSSVEKENLNVDALLALAQTPNLIPSHIHELVRLFAAAYVFPIAESIEKRSVGVDIGAHKNGDGRPKKGEEGQKA